MQELKERILKEGKVLPGNIVKPCPLCPEPSH